MFQFFKKKSVTKPEQGFVLSAHAHDEILERRLAQLESQFEEGKPSFRERYETAVSQKVHVSQLHITDTEHEKRMRKIRDAISGHMLTIQADVGIKMASHISAATVNPCSEITLNSNATPRVEDYLSFPESEPGHLSGSISAHKIMSGAITASSSATHAVDAAKYQFTTISNHGEATMAKKPLSHEERERMMDVGRRIIELAKDMVFDVEGIPTLTVKQSDGQYRKKVMSPEWGFTLIDVYVGSRETPIFVLEPIDSLPFEVIETSIKEADTTFPKLGGMIAAAAEITGTATLGGVFGIIENDMRKQAKENMVADQQAVASNPNWGRF